MLASRASGILLCHAGADRIAFLAQDVTSIDLPSALDGRSLAAGLAFGHRSDPVRVLLSRPGEGVGVDTLEIDTEPHLILGLPSLLGRAAGGSLRGFILARGLLWPLVSLVEFEHFLAGSSQEAA
ncbi:protein CrdC [Stigmatella hybrida]|uniref:protein CrdC n=1 Tax=Stigmatella hybrida TaxID=394097 RepID=UPI001CDAA2E2|nr:protein CrdC [Stigmatella hybrida]